MAGPLPPPPSKSHGHSEKELFLRLSLEVPLMCNVYFDFYKSSINIYFNIIKVHYGLYNFVQNWFEQF